MAYIDGFVMAVPVENRAEFIAHARTADTVFMEMGALRVIECWEEDVPDGSYTDFRRAVHAKEDEAIVFSWIEWPDKQTRDAAYATMTSPSFADERMDKHKNPMPFDGKRMIFGGFNPVVEYPG